MQHACGIANPTGVHGHINDLLLDLRRLTGVGIFQEKRPSTPQATRTAPRCRHPDTGDGAVRGASGLPALGAGLCPPVFDRWPEGLWHGIPEPFWPVDAPGTAPRQRASPETPLDASAPIAFRAGGAVLPASAPHRRQIPGGLWNDGAGCANTRGVRLEDQYSLCR